MTLRAWGYALIAIVLVEVLLTLAAMTVVAKADPTQRVRPARLEHRYLHLYWSVVRHHGRRAPGRNLVTRGMRTHGRLRPPSRRELARSVRTFQRWLAPPAGPSRASDYLPHGQSAAYQGGKWAIPASIVLCESGGSYSAVNTSNPNRPAGAYQVITGTWLNYGGGRYAPTADAATPAQQDEIAGRIYAAEGAGPWECR